MKSAVHRAGSVTRWSVFKRLAAMYFICWVCFYIFIVVSHFNGTLVLSQLPWLAQTPILPLFVIRQAASESGAWAAILIIGVVAVPFTLTAQAIQYPDRAALAKLAMFAVAANWLRMLNAMALGA